MAVGVIVGVGVREGVSVGGIGVIVGKTPTVGVGNSERDGEGEGIRVATIGRGVYVGGTRPDGVAVLFATTATEAAVGRVSVDDGAGWQATNPTRTQKHSQNVKRDVQTIIIGISRVPAAAPNPAPHCFQPPGRTVLATEPLASPRWPDP